MNVQLASPRRIAKGAVVLATFAGAFVLAHGAYAQLTKCSGKTFDPNGQCSRPKTCANPLCNTWVTPVATTMLIAGEAGDNWIASNRQKNCGTRGVCKRDKNNNCVQGTKMGVVQTNFVGDGQSCTIPQ